MARTISVPHTGIRTSMDNSVSGINVNARFAKHKGQRRVNDDSVYIMGGQLVFVYRKTMSLSNRIAYAAIALTCLTFTTEDRLSLPFTPPSPPQVQCPPEDKRLHSIKEPHASRVFDADSDIVWLCNASLSV